MTSTLTDPLLEYRSEFPILETSAYFAAHTLGPVCRESLEALRVFGEQWATRGVRAWGDSWFALPDVVGDAIGHLMNAPKNTVNTPPHATAAMASLLSSLDFSGTRNGIVTTDVEFPSVLQQTTAWSQYGANVTVVKSEDGLTPPLEGVLAAINETTKLVAICHVYFRNAYILDVKAVVKRAREVGALVCLDAYQSLGTVPLDVQVLDVDFVIGGSVKWVLAGPGVGYLYVRPSILETLEPALRGWMGHADPFGFSPDWKPASGQRRFVTGTPQVPSLAAALPGYNMVGKIGVDAIREKSLRQTQILMTHAEKLGMRIVNPKAADSRGGSVVLDVSPLAPEFADSIGHAVAATMNARDYVLDYRVGAGIRLAPHFYTKDSELEQVIIEMHHVIQTRAFTSHLERGKVT